MIEVQGDLKILSGRDIPQLYLKVISSRIEILLQDMAKSGHPFGHLLDASRVYEMIQLHHQEASLEVFVKDTETEYPWVNQRSIAGAVGYSFQDLWWAKKNTTALVESFVIGIDPEFNGFGRQVLKRFDQIAVEFDCQMIMTGNLMGLDPQLTANLYEKKGGYNFKYNHFFKMTGGN